MLSKTLPGASLEDRAHLPLLLQPHPPPHLFALLRPPHFPRLHPLAVSRSPYLTLHRTPLRLPHLQRHARLRVPVQDQRRAPRDRLLRAGHKRPTPRHHERWLRSLGTGGRALAAGAKEGGSSLVSSLRTRRALNFVSSSASDPSETPLRLYSISPHCRTLPLRPIRVLQAVLLLFPFAVARLVLETRRAALHIRPEGVLVRFNSLQLDLQSSPVLFEASVWP